MLFLGHLLFLVEVCKIPCYCEAAPVLRSLTNVSSYHPSQFLISCLLCCSQGLLSGSADRNTEKQVCIILSGFKNPSVIF